MLDIGESLVGSYLRYIEDCDFVHYETRTEQQGELDVIGTRVADRRIWLCEVTIHLNGLDYGSGYAATRDKIRQKIDRAEVFAQRLFEDQTVSYEFWSPQVPPGLATLLEELEAEYTNRGLDVTFVINEDFAERIRRLQERAAQDTKATAEPAYRLLQILSKLKPSTSS